MKKYAYAIGLLSILVVFYLIVVFVFIDKFDRDLSADRKSLLHYKTNSLSNEAYEIFSDNGCPYCHQKGTPLPFYFDWPIADIIIPYNINRGLHFFDIEPLMKNLIEEQPISDSNLAKLELVVNNDSMPPMHFTQIHWASTLTAQEKNTLLNWISSEKNRNAIGSNVNEQFKQESIRPIHQKFSLDSNKVSLGYSLFHSVLLSKNNTISCASCHDIQKGGADGRTVSLGINNRVGDINAPTVLNAALNIRQFWDGRADDLEHQAEFPPLNPSEMGSNSWNDIVIKLNQDNRLKERFKKTYPDGITKKNILNAIAEFERSLLTPNSRFDLFLKGNKSALTTEEINGFNLFKNNHCDLCHSGENMGGESFEIMGLRNDYFQNQTNIRDNGVYNITKDHFDLHRFKVPSLRNIELTPPYFHDASAKTLEDAVMKMAYYQLDKNLSKSDIDAITQFLKTTNGVIPTPQKTN